MATETRAVEGWAGKGWREHRFAGVITGPDPLVPGAERVTILSGHVADKLDDMLAACDHTITCLSGGVSCAPGAGPREVLAAALSAFRGEPDA